MQTSFYRRCGRSGILLSKISLGMWHNFGAGDDYDKCRQIARYAFENGITHFDLADTFAGHRHQLFIATKAGYDMWEGPYGSWGSRKHLITSLDQSLERMHLTYADLFYIHRYDPETPLEETLQALVDIVRSGRALYIGISRWPLEALKFANTYLRERDVPPLIYQGRLNLLDRAPQEEGIIDFCREQGIGFIGFSPLAEGLLTDRYLNGIPSDSRIAKGGHLKKERLTPELLAHLHELNSEAEAKGMTLAEMSLRWLISQEGVTSAIVGASSVEQLKKNLRAADIETE